MNALLDPVHNTKQHENTLSTAHTHAYKCPQWHTTRFLLIQNVQYISAVVVLNVIAGHAASKIRCSCGNIC
jgi:hypothetical protein